MQWKALNVKSNWKVKAHSWLQHEVMVMFRVSLSRFKHHWVSNSFYSSIKLEFYFYSSCHNSIKRTSKKSWNTSQKLSATIKEMYSLARLAMRHSENILSLCPLRGQLLVQPKKKPSSPPSTFTLTWNPPWQLISSYLLLYHGPQSLPNCNL